jgi:outer membrane protein TolC
MMRLTSLERGKMRKAPVFTTFLLTAVVMLQAIAFAAQVGAVDNTDGTQERYEGSLTLTQASARAKALGYDVRDARASARIATSEVGTQSAALAPQIGLSATALNGNLAQLGMPVANQAYGSASLSIPVLAVSASRGARAARESAAAAATDIETARQDAAFAAIQAYRRAQAAEAIANVRAVAVRDEKEHVRVTNLRIAGGKLPPYVAARDRAALAQAEQMFEEANAERDKALVDLAALLAYDPTASRITLADSLETAAFDRTREEILATALVRRSEVAAAKRRVIAAQLALAAARGAYVPSAMLTGQTYNGLSSPKVGGSGGQIMLALSLPIADGGSRAAAISRASGEFDRARIAFERIRANIMRDVIDARRDLEAARANLVTAKAGQEDAEAQRGAVLLREQAGKAIELEALDALSVVATARETVLRSLAGYDMAVAAVRRAEGDPTL